MNIFAAKHIMWLFIVTHRYGITLRSTNIRLLAGDLRVYMMTDSYRVNKLLNSVCIYLLIFNMALYIAIVFY